MYITMNKETKNKCCENCAYKSTNGLRHCIDIFNCPCHSTSQSSIEDTPVTPIEEKKLRYQINKIRNGCWRLEWEDGSFSEHSTQDGAEKMRMQIETSRASHPIEPSYTKQLKQKYLTDEEGTLTYTDKGLELLIEEVKTLIVQDMLELYKYNGGMQSEDILYYAKANGISLQAK